MNNDTIKFIVYGEPIPQPRVIDGDLKRNARGHAYMEKIDPAAKKKNGFLLKSLVHRPDRPFDCPLEVNLTFYFSRPKSHYGRHKGQPYLKPDAAEYHSLHKRCDLDNLTKFVWDALTGQFWTDDGIIAKSTQTKLYTDKLPYTEIEIKPLKTRKEND